MPDFIEGGNVGYMTTHQFDRFRNAVNETRNLVPWLRVAGYIRSGTDPDELRHRSSDHPLGLPPTWLAAEEISRLLQELNQYGELEDAANDEHGAWIGWELTREVETAGHKWPYQDKPHKVKFVRCDSCRMMTLNMMPPKNGRVILKCSECRAVMSEADFAQTSYLLEMEEHERRLGDRRAGRGKSAKVEEDDLAVGA